MKCFACGAELQLASQVGRRDECGSCGADVHVCRNCVHYDPKVYNECLEPQAEVVHEKDRANFCDYFLFNHKGLGASSAKENLLSAAEALFKKN